MHPGITSALFACAAMLPGERGSQRPAATDGRPDGRPNVILIVTDDQGYGDFGFTGNPVVQTPNLDRMAQASARLSCFYVSSVCAPTRASLMTGRYHQRTGVVSNGYPMRPEEVTVAEALRAAGYATAIFGKWHLGDHFPHRPGDQGFEESLVARGGIIGQLEPDPVVVKYTDPTLEHNGRIVSRQGFATDVYFDAACAWIRQAHEDGRSFFATIATNAPHRPYDDVPEDLRKRYAAMNLTPALGYGTRPEGKDVLDELARVYALVTKIDQNVGKLFALLEELRLVDDTLVLFLCDNGPSEARFNADLAGRKASIREGGIRSPLLAHWPGKLPAGVASDRVALHLDLAPTILDACGVDAAGLAPDGRSLLPLLRRDAIEWPDRTVFFQARFDGDLRRYRSFAARTQRWKLVVGDFADDASSELYDLEADPLEELDVAGEHPETAAELRREYELWLADVSHQVEATKEPAVRVGAPEENPVLLTHHRWALARERPRTLSSWDLEIAESGLYDIRFLFPPERVARTARLQLLRQYTAEVPKGARDCLFRRVRLRRGRLRLGAVVWAAAGKPQAVWQVEIRRL